jgi:5-methylthioadenosine/S-adenosylhomocysteine deaminase
MAEVTHYKGCSWIIAWDASRQDHCYIRGGDVAFCEDEISYVGTKFVGKADHVLDGRGLMLLPGLINIHCHPRSQPILKGIIEELGSPKFYMSGLYDVKAAFKGDEETAIAGAEVTYAELLSGGVTTVVELSRPYPGWIEMLGKSGLRGVVAPTFAAAEWFTEDGHRLQYRWNLQEGRRTFQRAQETMDEAERHTSKRLSAIVAPDTLDTCDAALLSDAVALAKDKKRKLTVHCAESVVEFNEFTRRHGQTPLQHAASHKLLNPDTILGHAIFLDQHSWLHWTPHRDLRLLAESGASVAHCPLPFARYGQTMEDVGTYMRAGINIGIGTDTFPHNLLEEMRLACLLARVAAEDIETITTRDLFRAATVGGAKAIGRDDIGRLAAGTRADIVVVDTEHLSMRPLRDPLRSLVHSAAERAVRDVYVAGRKVVDNGGVVNLNPREAISRLEEGQRRAERGAPARDFLGRTGEQIAPLSFPVL